MQQEDIVFGDGQTGHYRSPKASIVPTLVSIVLVFETAY